MITKLKDNEIFVFGSNLAGHHIGGAARQAYEDFGALWGRGEGLMGQSYAFPTLNVAFQKRKLIQLGASVFKLYKCCEDNPDKEFLLTKVGCGIAQYPEEEMKNLFINPPKNLILPPEWRERTQMNIIDREITQFQGETFSSHEDSIKWLRDSLQRVIDETKEKCIEALPKKKNDPCDCCGKPLNQHYNENGIYFCPKKNELKSSTDYPNVDQSMLGTEKDEGWNESIQQAKQNIEGGK